MDIVSGPFRRTLSNDSSIVAYNKPISYWLFGVSGLVAGMVTVGGITRLTKSGLSMTDWTVQGSLPPITLEEWNNEFERYKMYPEWRQRQSMTLDEFKFIYYWEYGHRMMGRMLGIAYGIPLLYFAMSKKIPSVMYTRLGLLFTLGGTQGLIGWWMVKSGLDVNPEQKKEIRVSPYRLATHLSLAITTYGLLLWTGLEMNSNLSNMRVALQKIPQEYHHHMHRLRRFTYFNMALVGVTALSGAFVAGNDAGRAYNTFPMMGNEWIPSEILVLKPLWRNLCENTATVQFDHRTLALLTLSSVTACYMTCRTVGQGILWSLLPVSTKLAFNSIISIAYLQVGLGITTLLLYVPVPLAVLHQAGSIALLTSAIFTAHSMTTLNPNTIASTIRIRSIINTPNVIAFSVITTALGTLYVTSSSRTQETTDVPTSSSIELTKSHKN